MNDHATFFIDTGSSVSLVSNNYVDCLGLANQITAAPNINISSFTSNKIKTYGTIDLPITLANQTTNHRMIVSNLIDTHFLIGMDFLKPNKINIDVTRQCITSPHGNSQFLNRFKQQSKPSPLVSAKTRTIPANTVMFITATVTDFDRDYCSTGFIEPRINLLTEKGLLIDSSLCYSENKQTPVRVSNLNDIPIQIHKNKVLGKVYPTENKCDSTLRSIHLVDTNQNDTEKINLISEVSDYRIPDTSDNISNPPANSPDSHDNIPDPHVNTSDPPESKEWEQNQLWTKLRLDDITEVTEKERVHLKDIIWRYRKCFSNGPFDLGECKQYEAEITLKPNYTPSWVPARPVPYKLRDTMDTQIRGLEKAGVIERCSSKSYFNSPVFLVKKPHQPDKMRFVCDMRGVNVQCLPDSYQMPLIGHVVDKVAGNKWYSTFDCSQSFHQIRYNKESRHITAFTTANGSRYWFRKMIMGHKNSGAQFSRIMSKIMTNLPFEQLVFFLDDLLLASETVSSHLERLELVLQRLLTAGMKLSVEKCHFLQRQVQFVGVTLNSEGIQITEERIKALLELQAPSDRKSLQSLLGFFGYNRKWIPQYAALTKCMYQLLQKGKPFHWTKECDQNLLYLKEAVRNSITLAVPDLYDSQKSYELVIDGSKYGMGAHLSQVINGTRRVIGYFSKAIPSHKREWSQTKLELLTLFHAIKFWDPYLRGTDFSVKTDCLSICSLDTIFRKNDANLRRKVQALAHYSFSIEHLPGKANHVADFFSRYPYKKKYRESATQCDLVLQAKHGKVSQITNQKPTNRDENFYKMVEVVSTLCTQQNRMKEQRNQPDTPEILHEDPPSLAELIPDWIFDTNDCNDNPIAPASTQNPKDTLKCVCYLIQTDDQLNSNNNSHSAPSSDKDTLSSPITKDPDIQPSVKDLSISTTANSQNSGPSITALSSLLHEIKDAQESDPVLSTVKSWLIAEAKPKSLQAHRAPKSLVSYWKQFSLLELNNSIIMRKWIAVKDGTTQDRLLTCIPDSLQEKVVQLCHNSRTINHPGIRPTLDTCRRYFYWCNMANDVELYVNACTTCGKMKQPQSYSKAVRQHIIAHQFNDILVIDHVEPEKIGITQKGNKYILSITDVWSGYVVAVATNSQKATDNISLIMHHWVLKHGVPRDVISDGAPGFKAQFYKAVLTSLNCNYTYGLPYECKSTSKAERTNKRLNQSLRLILDNKDPKLWDRYLNYVCAVLNSLKNRQTGFSANFLVYGRELNTPMSLLLENGDQADVFDPNCPVPYNEQAYEQHRAHKNIIQTISKKLKSYYAHADISFNKGIKNTPFKAKDLCYIKIRCPTHKFSPRWFGPIPVIKVINDHVYVVQLPNGEKVVNISKLKKYRGKHLPSSFQAQIERLPVTVTSSQPHSLPPSQLPKKGLQIVISGDKPSSPMHSSSKTISPDTTSTADLPNIAEIPEPETLIADNTNVDTNVADISNADTPSFDSITDLSSNGEPTSAYEVSNTRPKRTVRFTQPLQVNPRAKSYKNVETLSKQLILRRRD